MLALDKINLNSIKELKEKYHNLRGSYFRQKRKVEQSEEDPGKIWIWYEDFHFLANDFDKEKDKVVPVNYINDGNEEVPPSEAALAKHKAYQAYRSVHKNCGQSCALKYLLTKNRAKTKANGTKRKYREDDLHYYEDFYGQYEDYYEEEFEEEEPFVDEVIRPKISMEPFPGDHSDEVDTYLLSLGTKLRKLDENRRLKMQKQIMKVMKKELKHQALKDELKELLS